METEARAAKVAVVDEVRGRLNEAEAVIVTEYRGLTVDALSSLRRELRPAGGKYRVYKNTLTRIAAAEAGVPIEDLLVGPTALAFVEQTPEGEDGDVVTVAKVLRDFAKSNPDLIIKGGVFEGEVIDTAALNRLADVEPREVLLARFAGLIAAPMQQMAGMLQALPRDFAYGLKALIDEGGADGAPAPETNAPEAPAVDEAPAAESPAEAPAEDAGTDDAPEPAAEDAAPEASTEEASTEEAPENDSPEAGEGEES